uniref:Uncharacterized protein n=1 Tax=Nelumbo nucifera TaxID=4432 RepID=A0A822ZC50_NELNU|nr:TPA_asm: hypothetical protein HUJ06_000942 [Nelumbo nucifera]
MESIADWKLFPLFYDALESKFKFLDCDFQGKFLHFPVNPRPDKQRRGLRQPKWSIASYIVGIPLPLRRGFFQEVALLHFQSRFAYSGNGVTEYCS